MPKGLPVSPGVAVGKAYCVHEVFVGTKSGKVDPSAVQAELERYEDARDKTSTDLKALHTKVAKQVGAREAEIFRVHEAILHDPAFTSKIRQSISEGHLSAPAALDKVLNEYAGLFSRTSDEYLRD